MQILITKFFHRFQRKERIDDEQLVEAISAAERGLIDADLGGGLIKQRVARPGQGKRGGYRTIIAYRAGDRCIFLFGFAKSSRANISDNDLRDLHDYATLLMGLTEAGIARLVDAGELKEVNHGEGT